MTPGAIAYIVDDDPEIRQWLRLLLNEHATVKEVETAEAFLDIYDPERPGCLILDIRLPGMTGLQLQETLRSKDIEIPVIIMTGDGTVSDAVRAMRNGALDLLEKPFTRQTLLERVEQAINIDLRNRKVRQANFDKQRRLERLTPREREVMDLLVAGKCSKQVAAQLEISLQAVNAHRARITRKLGVENIVDVARLLFGPEFANAPHA